MIIGCGRLCGWSRKPARNSSIKERTKHSFLCTSVHNNLVAGCDITSARLALRCTHSTVPLTPIVPMLASLFLRFCWVPYDVTYGTQLLYDLEGVSRTSLLRLLLRHSSVLESGNGSSLMTSLSVSFGVISSPHQLRLSLSHTQFLADC